MAGTSKTAAASWNHNGVTLQIQMCLNQEKEMKMYADSSG